MTTSRHPVHHHVTRGVPFDDLAPGDTLSDALTITETHVVLAAAIFNDPGPNHLNALQAETNRFGARIAHGPLLVGFMAGILGNVLGATIEALLEQHSRFRHPVFLGDTLTGTWEVTETIPKETFTGGGIVHFGGVAHNQAGTPVLEASMVLAVANRPLWQPAGPPAP